MQVPEGFVLQEVNGEYFIPSDGARVEGDRYDEMLWFREGRSTGLKASLWCSYRGHVCNV